MPVLLHITERTAWENARQTGSYRMSTRGMSLDQQGFIHCSLPHQLRGVAETVYTGVDDLVVLVIDQASLPAEVRYEDGGSGDLFPHIYGPLPVTSVTEVIPVTRDATGRMILPEDG